MLRTNLLSKKSKKKGSAKKNNTFGKKSKKVMVKRAAKAKQKHEIQSAVQPDQAHQPPQ